MNATKDRRSEAEKQVVGAFARRRSKVLVEIDDRRDDAQECRKGIGEELGLHHWDAGDLRRRFVVADGIDVAAPLAAVEEKGGADKGDHRMTIGKTSGGAAGSRTGARSRRYIRRP